MQADWGLVGWGCEEDIRVMVGPEYIIHVYEVAQH